MTPLIECAPVPCVTCPYRRDVPSGVWSRDEYAKLPPYDAETWGQPPSLFMCHTSPDGLCTGWLQCHTSRDHQYDLLALRLARGIDREAVSRVATAEPAVALFSSGTQAAGHGLRDVARPKRAARAAIQRLVVKRKR